MVKFANFQIAQSRSKEQRSGSSEEPIEPLHGIGRNPFSQVGCGGNTSFCNIQYLIIKNFCGDEIISKSILFDMGASVGFAGVPKGFLNETPSVGGGRSSSIPLLNRLYYDKCIVFDEICAWEPSIVVSHEVWWGSAPVEMRAKTRFYQTGVVEGELSEALNGTRNPASFLQMLVSAVKAENYVVVKLDIDTPEVEHVVMQVLASLPGIASEPDHVIPTLLDIEFIGNLLK